ncbi:MAG: MATE family efflux transporter [Methanobrevibacter sp.]|jgi:putative MATE family efflux protein|nr:MATE family efflux transporter [Candidatus Methanovirga australis]
MTKSIEKTEGVDILLGDPKKAILKLSLPLIIGMIINYSYTLIDGIWVAGLGSDALAATGFIIPLYFIGIGLTNGIGTGAAVIISQYIGSEDKIQANNAAFHVLILIIFISVLSTILGLLFLKPMLSILRAGSTSDLAYQYGSIFIGGSFFMFFINASYGILRGEGNVKKATYAIILGAILNILFDPVFIYYFSLGISGAAYASILSMIIVSIILIKWFKKDTYIEFSYKNFTYDKTILKRILYVGLPAGAEFLILATETFIINIFLTIVSGIQGVAIYSAGWRFILFTIVPLTAISLSVVSVTGASYGGKRFQNLLIIRNYAIKLEILISIFIATVTFIFAKDIAQIFAYSNQTQSFFDGMIVFLRNLCFFILFIPIGSIAGSIFQGLGRGFDSLILALIREFILVIIIAYIFAITLSMGENGVWLGIVVGNIIGSLFAFIYSQIAIKNISINAEKNTN